MPIPVGLDGADRPRGPGPGPRPIAAVTARFEARPAGLADLQVACEQLFAAAASAGAPVRRADRVPLVTAAAEITANIVLHACALLPGSEVTATLSRFAHSVEILFEDSGRPFLEGTSGRGLTIARASVHLISYDRKEGRNRWRLVRHTGLGTADDGWIV